MLASTLVVWMGEFGRTPIINAKPGATIPQRSECAGWDQGGQVDDWRPPNSPIQTTRVLASMPRSFRSARSVANARVECPAQRLDHFKVVQVRVPTARGLLQRRTRLAPQPGGPAKQPLPNRFLAVRVS